MTTASKPPEEKSFGVITRDGDFINIRIARDEVQSLRIALQPCACKAAKSKATAGIRERLSRGLARAMFAKSD